MKKNRKLINSKGDFSSFVSRAFNSFFIDKLGAEVLSNKNFKFYIYLLLSFETRMTLVVQQAIKLIPCA